MTTDNAKAWNEFIVSESEEAFRVLYTHYFRYLTFIGLKKSFPAGQVKDAINDLFLYLWERKNKLGAVTNFHNYILTIFLRKLYKKEETGNDPISDTDLPAELLILPSVEHQYIDLEVQQGVSRIVRDFVGKLPDRQRQMIYQKFYLGMSYKEISDLGKVSINTVYNTIYKAVEKLKTKMEKK
jgi:RNA polymerase sigma factor (sigma-70 family)